VSKTVATYYIVDIGLQQGTTVRKYLGLPEVILPVLASGEIFSLFGNRHLNVWN